MVLGRVLFLEEKAAHSHAEFSPGLLEKKRVDV
jgi:hypothetical protein